ncbi:MAG: ABATE domain-containing protein [Nitrospirales bacterium]
MAKVDSQKMTDVPLPAIFVAGALALDFLNSLATPADVPVEWLASGEALVNWLGQAELVPDDALQALVFKAVPGELDAVAGQARALREWFRGFVHKYRGKALSHAALKKLEPLNRILFRDERFGQIVLNKSKTTDGESRTFAWEEIRRWRSSESLLIPIAESMANLVCNEDFTYVKACQGHACTLLFIDRTRRRARRWCSMTVCGNRAKQAAFRTRGSIVK